MCGDKNYEAKSNSKETFSDQIEEVKRKFENLAKEAKIDNMEQPKREPLADGVLPLTNEEKAELNKMLRYGFCVDKVKKYPRVLRAIDEEHIAIIEEYAAIIWLAERFSLDGKTKEGNGPNGFSLRWRK